MKLCERILRLLNDLPHPLPTPRIVALCGTGPSPKTCVRAQLLRMERVGLVVRVRASGRRVGQGCVRWTSPKWVPLAAKEFA